MNSLLSSSYFNMTENINGWIKEMTVRYKEKTFDLMTDPQWTKVGSLKGNHKEYSI